MGQHHQRIHGAPIAIASVADLRKKEAAIVRHINELQHGGMLFYLNPLRLLREIGVDLDPTVVTAIVRAHPEIERCGGPAYDHIAASPHDQKLHITMRGLFDLASASHE